MATANVVHGDLVVQGNLSVLGDAGITPAIERTSLAQEQLARHKIQMTDWRVWDAFQTVLPGTSATDDLALIGGTFGTASPSIQTYDVKAAGAVTLYARCLFNLPHTYDTAQTVTLRAHAGMLTTISDGTATIDFAVYRSNDEAGIGSDLSTTTAATTINSLVLSNKDFVITATSLSPGDTLDIRMAIAIADTATATAVKGIVGSVELLLDSKG
jgi:hypothetical protein